MQQPKILMLRDPRNLMLAVGLAQILEIYCESSLQAQHNYRFPTQAWDTLLEQKARLDSLGENWQWGAEDLKYTDIEAPAKVKERLMTSGVYRPAINLDS